MPNVNRPQGLAPIGYLNGAPWNGQARMYCILAADTNAYAIGDPLTLAGSADSRGISAVTVAVAGGIVNPVVGALLGMSGSTPGGAYGDLSNLGTMIIPATKSRVHYVLVADDPNTIFEVQEVETGTPMVAADIGLNTSLIATAGANNTGHNGTISGWKLDNVSKAVTATLQMKILGLTQRVDNTFGQYAKFMCLINHHCYRNGVLGV